MLRTRKRAREDSPIFPGGNRQVSPGGGGLPLSTAYLGNYVCHVCPFARFISHHPSRIHLSRSHAAFPPIEVGLQRSCVPKRKCCLNITLRCRALSLQFTIAGARGEDSSQYCPDRGSVKALGETDANSPSRRHFVT